MNSKAIETLFIKALGNSRIENPIVGDLTSYSKVDSRNKDDIYKVAGKEYCNNKFNERNFGTEIQRIIREIDNSGTAKDFSNLINFTLVPGIYEEGMGDGNFPKIRQDVLQILNRDFFPVNELPEINGNPNPNILIKENKIGNEDLGINLLNKSFIKNKGDIGGSEIEAFEGDKFFKERLKYFTRTGKPDIKNRVDSFKSGIEAVLKNITTKGSENYFLVSHSQFMQALYKSICEIDKVPYFDNLDVLHLIVKDKKILVKGIYRYKHSYELDTQSFFGKCTRDSTKDLKEPYLNLFMMRHCVACHNVVDDFTKLKKKVFRSSNFGSTSMCLLLVKDLNKTDSNGNRKIMGLIKMLRENTGTDKLIKSINFGSSVSLRTTLTGLVVQRLIALNTNPGNEAIESRSSKSHFYNDDDMEEIKKIITNPNDNLKDELNNKTKSIFFSEDQRFEIIKLLNEKINDVTTKQPYIDTFIFYKEYLYLNKEIDFTTFLYEKETYNDGIHEGRKKFIGRMYPTTSSGESKEVSKKNYVKQELQQEKGAKARKEAEAATVKAAAKKKAEADKVKAAEAKAAKKAKAKAAAKAAKKAAEKEAKEAAKKAAKEEATEQKRLNAAEKEQRKYRYK